MLTDLPMVCFGPMVTSNLPPLPSLKEMLCRRYTGMATILRNKSIGDCKSAVTIEDNIRTIIVLSCRSEGAVIEVAKAALVVVVAMAAIADCWIKYV